MPGTRGTGRAPLQGQPATCLKEVTAGECFMSQPRDRFRRSVNWSNFSASGKGIWAVTNFIPGSDVPSHPNSLAQNQ